MQFSKTLLTIVSVAAVGSAQTISLPSSAIPTSKYPSISSRLYSDLSTLASAQASIPVSLAQAVYSALATVTADTGGLGYASGGDYDLNDQVSAINAIITGTPTWLAGMPSDVQSYLKSLATQEAIIYNRDINAGVRTDAIIKAGIAAAVGVAVGAVLVL